MSGVSMTATEALFAERKLFGDDELIAAASRVTYHRLRAEAMGFKFSVPRVIDLGPHLYHDSTPSLRFRNRRLLVDFQCVCGRTETFNSSVPNDMRYLPPIDVALELHRLGSFSAEHLRRDGYSEASIAEILAKGEAFDKITSEHWAASQPREQWQPWRA